MEIKDPHVCLQNYENLGEYNYDSNRKVIMNQLIYLRKPEELNALWHNTSNLKLDTFIKKILNDNYISFLFHDDKEPVLQCIFLSEIIFSIFKQVAKELMHLDQYDIDMKIRLRKHKEEVKAYEARIRRGSNPAILMNKETSLIANLFSFKTMWYFIEEFQLLKCKSNKHEHNNEPEMFYFLKRNNEQSKSMTMVYEGGIAETIPHDNNCDQGKKDENKSKAHTDWIQSVTYNHDCTKILSGAKDKTIKIWNARTGECLDTLDTKHDKQIRCIAYIYNPALKIEPMIASASADTTIKIWNVASKKELEPIAVLERHEYPVRTLAYSQAKNHLVSGEYWYSLCL